jgi:hypothetical protein
MQTPLELPEDWPLWALILGQALAFLFKSQLAKLIPDTVRDMLKSSAQLEAERVRTKRLLEVDQQEYTQELEFAQVDAKIQAEVAAQLRDVRKEQEYFGLIKGQQGFIQNTLVKYIQDLGAGVDSRARDILDELVKLRRDTMAERRVLIRLSDIVIGLHSRVEYDKEGKMYLALTAELHDMIEPYEENNA